MAAISTTTKAGSSVANTNTTNTTATSTKKGDPVQLKAMTEKLAYELWEKRGRRCGGDVQDWLEAEKAARQKLGM